MRCRAQVLAAVLAAGAAALLAVRLWPPGPPAGAAPPEDYRDQSGLRRVADRVFVHAPTGVSFTLPDGWQETDAHRLERKIDPRATAVLRADRPDREATATLTWVKLHPNERVRDWVRDTPADGEYGEEYETLKAVYGRDQVTPPVRLAHGPFTAYRINYFIPTGGTERLEGAVLLIPVEAGGATWLLQSHVSYPKAERGRRDEYVLAVLRGYGRQPQ
jgi:hypothetical protein